MELSILNKKGKDTGRKVKLSQSVFGIEPSDHAIYLDVKQHLANSRQGTHKTKERSEIRGSTRKIKKQKGTGTARAGSIKNPIFRGGGRTFGPLPRDYSIKVNKKVMNLSKDEILSFRRKMLQKMKGIGRAHGAKGGGNARKRFYLTVADFDQLTLEDAKDLLAS